MLFSHCQKKLFIYTPKNKILQHLQKDASEKHLKMAGGKFISLWNFERTLFNNNDKKVCPDVFFRKKKKKERTKSKWQTVKCRFRIAWCMKRHEKLNFIVCNSCEKHIWISDG